MHSKSTTSIEPPELVRSAISCSCCRAEYYNCNLGRLWTHELHKSEAVSTVICPIFFRQELPSESHVALHPCSTPAVDRGGSTVGHVRPRPSLGLAFAIAPRGLLHCRAALSSWGQLTPNALLQFISSTGTGRCWLVPQLWYPTCGQHR